MLYVCMYVCMYVCPYVSTYVCMYVCTYVCMYVCMYAYMHVRMYVCMCVRMYVCIHVCTYVYYVCMYVCMIVCIYVCMYACMQCSSQNFSIAGVRGIAQVSDYSTVNSRHNFFHLSQCKAKLTNPCTKVMDFCPCTHNPHDLTQELKQSGENKSRVGRIKAGWG